MQSAAIVREKVKVNQSCPCTGLVTMFFKLTRRIFVTSDSMGLGLLLGADMRAVGVL